MRWYDFPGQDDEYKRRRAELLAAEIALKDQVERVAALRRALPVGMRVHDYAFREGPLDLARNDPADFREVRLSELFTGGHDTPLVDHLMFGPGGALALFSHGDPLTPPTASTCGDRHNS